MSLNTRNFLKMSKTKLFFTILSTVFSCIFSSLGFISNLNLIPFVIFLFMWIIFTGSWFVVCKLLYQEIIQNNAKVRIRIVRIIFIFYIFIVASFNFKGITKVFLSAVTSDYNPLVFLSFQVLSLCLAVSPFVNTELYHDQS
jgi:hypothetical protein